ncbi:MAG: DUF5678 domain-containing protein [bacterium]|nr:DUF5678 domain-containing protein [bacterium]
MAIDWTKNFKKYKGLWVAMKKDQITVVASGNTAKDVLEKAREIGISRPVLFKVPSQIIPYIGGFRRA